jgi:hypothetical protein
VSGLLPKAKGPIEFLFTHCPGHAGDTHVHGLLQEPTRHESHYRKALRRLQIEQIKLHKHVIGQGRRMWGIVTRVVACLTLA